jgi:hypothetical protein
MVQKSPFNVFSHFSSNKKIYKIYKMILLDGEVARTFLKVSVSSFSDSFSKNMSDIKVVVQTLLEMQR